MLPSLLKSILCSWWFKQLTAVLWNAAWRLSNEVTDNCAGHDGFKPGLLHHAEFGMKASTLSCTTNKLWWRGWITSVCCALWWLTVRLEGMWKSWPLQSLLRGGKQDYHVKLIGTEMLLHFPWTLAEKIYVARWRCQTRRNISFIKLTTHSYVLSRSSVAQSLSILMMFWNREKPLWPLWEGWRGEQLTIKEAEDAQVNCFLTNWREV